MGADRRILRAESNGASALLILHEYVENPARRLAFRINADGSGAWMTDFLSPADLVFHDGSGYLLDVAPATETASFEGTIFRSRDARSWRPVVRFLSTSAPVSLEFLRNRIFVGLMNGELWEFSI